MKNYHLLSGGATTMRISLRFEHCQIFYSSVEGSLEPGGGEERREVDLKLKCIHRGKGGAVEHRLLFPLSSLTVHSLFILCGHTHRRG